MSDFKKFYEYLNSRGKLDAKGKVNKTGDEIDLKKPKAKDDPHNQKRNNKQQIDEYLSPKGKMVGPIESEDGDTYQQAGKRESSPEGNTSPYRASGKSSNGWDREAGFADSGAKELIYNPKTEVKNSPAGGDNVPSWPKNQNEKNSSPAVKTESFQMKALANRMRSQGTLADFMEAALSFPEVRRALQEFFTETVAPPVGIDKKKIGMNGPEELADADGEDELLDPEDEMGDEEFGDEELEGDEGPEGEGDFEDEDIDPDDEFAPEDEEEDDMEDMPMPPPRKKRPMIRRPLGDHPMMKMMQGM